MTEPLRSIRGNLSAANVPLLSSFSGRTIILPQYDQNYNRFVVSQGDADKDIGIPQVFYTHNCLPTGQGFQSIGYDLFSTAALPTVTDFDKCFLLTDSANNKALFVPSGGKNYVYTGVSRSWNSISPLAPGTFPSNGLITVAYIHSRTFVYYEKVGCFEYDFINNVFNSVNLVGLNPLLINGILSSQGYLIAYDSTTVYYSNTNVETDFVPNLATGAGSISITDLRGSIVAVLALSSGFIIYSDKNAVGASYSGNIRFPWIFKEISNSAGISSTENVTWQSNLPYHFAWTPKGLMKVDKSGAQDQFAEVTDFLTAKVMEDYDETTTLFSIIKTASQLITKLAFIGRRYLVISYGITQYTHALVYDSTLQRWGKLKVDHVDCFEWPAPNFFGIRTYGQLLGNTYGALKGTSYGQLSTQQTIFPLPKKDIAFLQIDGTIKTVNFDLETSDHTGVLIIGKYQFVRTRMLIFQGLDLETVNDSQSTGLDVTLLSTFDGKTFTTSKAFYKLPKTPGGETVQYLIKVAAWNHAIRVTGSFHATSLVIYFTLGASR